MAPNDLSATPTEVLCERRDYLRSKYSSDDTPAFVSETIRAIEVELGWRANELQAYLSNGESDV
jgi:hypothetical protein